MKKIALIVDKDNWAFYNIATNIKKYLSYKYEITIYVREYTENIVSLIFCLQKYDLIHFFWRGDLDLFDNEFVKEYLNYSGIEYKTFYEKYISHLNITTSVYDHLFLEPENIDFTQKIITRSKNYTVCSAKLFNIYNKFDKKPTAVITDGVDVDMFKNIKKRKNEIFTIGWVGNSNWGKDYYEDAKGVNTILKPAIKIVKNRGYKIKEYFADSSKKYIPKTKMPKYYEKIDLLVCTSMFEGTPNPVLEAMACGIPIITTDVGIVNEVFGDLQKQYILKERSSLLLAEAIEKIIKDKEMRKNLSNENKTRIKLWDWENITKKFDIFFEKNL